MNCTNATSTENDMEKKEGEKDSVEQARTLPVSRFPSARHVDGESVANQTRCETATAASTTGKMSDDDDRALPPSLCSVLTTVVDFCMMPPSPHWEPEDVCGVNNSCASNKDQLPSRANSQTLLVPVMRVFGPILRRDNPNENDCNSKLYPYQSACLYIHGAFPYLLARPRSAGPDGQSRVVVGASAAGGGGLEGDDDNVQSVWNDIVAVQRMIPVLHSVLETAVQETNFALLEDNQKNNKTANTSTSTTNGPGAPTGSSLKKKSPPPIIRKITVVMGRGFYGYCPGPPAPFIRVEYYNPQDRWKVKRCLEQGLADLPSLFHPNSNDNAEEKEETMGRKTNTAQRQQHGEQLLQFHCYEAHIPYTMQFFKDWNLAGLSYIHISSAKFREPLPSSIRNSKSNRKPVSDRSLFLASNTPIRYTWRGNQTTASVAKSDATNRPESDITQEHELPQIADVEKVAGKDIKEDEWMPPVTKQTSCDVELDISVLDILNVLDVMKELPGDDMERNSIHWRAVPSLREIWTQERRRMAKLLPPRDDFLSNTVKHPSLTLNVKNNASVPGAKLAREGMKRLLATTDGLEENFQRSCLEIVERHPVAIKIQFQQEQKESCVEQQRFTPYSPVRNPNAGRASMHTDHNYLDVALGTNKLKREDLTPSFDEALGALDSLKTIFDNGSTTPPKLSAKNFLASSDDKSTFEKGPCRQSMSENSAEFGRDKLSQDSDLFQYAQASKSRLSFESLSQTFFMYPHAEPVVLDGDGSKSLEEEFELTQKMERGDSIVDGPFYHIDDVINPETLTPFERADDEDDSSSDDSGEGDKILDESKLEQVLSTFATQTLLPATNNDLLDDDDENDSSIDSRDLMTRNLLERTVNVKDSVLEKHFNFIGRGSSEFTSNIGTEEWKRQANNYIEQRKQPPSRKDVIDEKNTGNLYPIDAESGITPWTSFLVDHQRMHTASGCNDDWFPPVPPKGVVVQQIISAPNYAAVASWYKRTLKKTIAMSNEANGLTTVRKRRLENSEEDAKQMRKRVLNQLQIVENDCQFVVECIGDANHYPTRGEEVDWKSSVPMTQGSSREEEDAARTAFSSKSGSQVSSDDVQNHIQYDCSGSTPTYTSPLGSGKKSSNALSGIGNQGGRIWVQGGGELKAKVNHTQAEKNIACLDEQNSVDCLPCPVSVMAIEILTQCRVGRSTTNDLKHIPMTPDSTRDAVVAIICVYGQDPGGGEPFEFLDFSCAFVPHGREGAGSLTESSSFDKLTKAVRRGMPRCILGVSAPVSVECVRDERQLLLRLSSIVRMKDPDMLLSWDTQGAGIGYLIERGMALGKDINDDSGSCKKLDLARLLSRIPTVSVVRSVEGKHDGSDPAAAILNEAANVAGKMISNEPKHEIHDSNRWKGSGLGSEWDDRVGAGAAAASIGGRLVFAAWKIIAEEVKHPNSSYLPSVVSSVLGKRIPFHDNLKLANWYGNERGRDRWRSLRYRLLQAVAYLRIFDALDIIGRSGEAARLSGVELSQSFPGIRGSQYKVEGVLLRALRSLNSNERGSKNGRHIEQSAVSLSADSKSQTQSPWKVHRNILPREHEIVADSDTIHHLNDRCYYFFSPSLRDANKQEALEVQALTLEPQSGHLKDPVVVCDFTALYPSLVIAYNLCYSTCAGKLDYHSTREEMRRSGRTTGKVGPMQYSEARTATVLQQHMKSLYGVEGYKDRAYIAPTGSIFVSEAVVKGVLPQVLDEILSTRAMIKKAAKLYKKHVPDLSSSILRQLEARQLALKYVANVTYGYTSATFSGRCAMPLLADAIVECGRRTLTNAIRLANCWGKEPGNKWNNIEVIYGDTDSIFVKLPGRTVQEAFAFGEEFCQAVTRSNPPPVQLKLEKVYLGSMMQTKKKYCGMKFESRNQKEPIFEAKGIETVRRDQCALTQKILTNSLKTLYIYGIKALRKYLHRQWSSILSGHLPISDFILTGRVRSRYRNGKEGPVQAALARRLAESDPGRVVRHKERQAYVIVATPGIVFKLKDCVLTPMELLEQWDSYTINSAYYITKHVNAALQRCLGLNPYHVNVEAWYSECSKPRRRIHFWPATRSGGQSNLMISSFFGSDRCSLCGKRCLATTSSRASICQACHNNPTKAFKSALENLNSVQNAAHEAAMKCSRCNLCFEDGATYAQVSTIQKRSKWGKQSSATSAVLVTPLANCICIDCPVTFERHRLREEELEAVATCEALDTSRNFARFDFSEDSKG